MLNILKCCLIVVMLVNISSGSTFIYPKDSVKREGSECTTKTNVTGTCKKIDDCESAEGKVDSVDLCSFLRDVPTYCCPNPIVVTTSEPVLEKLLVPRPIEEICEYYYPRWNTPKDPFTGGTRTLADQYPHMAALGWNNSEGGIDWLCGGAVVTANFVMTAAHCTESGGEPPIVVRTGDLNLLVTENNTFPQDFEITAIFVHPDYKPNEVYHDIAFLKISPDFGKRDLLPACIWPEYEIKSEYLVAMGYGTLEFSGPKANELFHGWLKLQTDEECRQNVPITPDVPKGIIRSQICAQDPKNVMDTCQGDSGGPLQFYRRVGYSFRPLIAGITSFGQNCAGSVPGVYTRVSEYLDWIEEILLSDFHNRTAEYILNSSTTIQP